jgi:O-antigen/teichoic acid export membrane protein
MGNRFLESRVFHWSKKGGIAILDQVLFNGVHFLIIVLLARWLEPVEYGIFAVAYSIFLLFASFHMAILTEPMLVFGSGKYRGMFNKYLGILVIGNFLFTIIVSLILMVVGVLIGFLYTKEMSLTLLSLSINMPFILLLWLLRRAFYVNLKPIWSVIGGVGYFILLLAIVFFLHLAGWLSATLYFISMGVCSLLISLFFIFLLRPGFIFKADTDVLAIAKDHLSYGKWAVGTGILSWCMNNVYFVILPFWIGLQGVAGLRALMNLSTPFTQTSSALSFLLIPVLSRKRIDGASKISGVVKLLLSLSVVIGLLYFLGLIFFGRGVMGYIYNNKYLEFSALIPLVGLLSLLGVISLVFESALRSLNNPDKVFWSYLISVLIVLFGVIFFAKFFGLRGVLCSYSISYLVVILMLAFFTRSKITWLMNHE